MPSLRGMVDGARRHFGDSLSPNDAYLSCEFVAVACYVLFGVVANVWQTMTFEVSDVLSAKMGDCGEEN
jgi:hypothetical protein